MPSEKPTPSETIRALREEILSLKNAFDTFHKDCERRLSEAELTIQSQNRRNSELFDKNAELQVRLERYE